MSKISFETNFLTQFAICWPFYALKSISISSPYRRRSDRRKRSDNPDKVMAPPSNGGSAIPPGMVGGPSLKATMEKDELNHIIPESKKFPQVGSWLFSFFLPRLIDGVDRFVVFYGSNWL